MNDIDWSGLYALAEEILALAPWKTFQEEKLFAIQPRREGPIYFVSIMGSRGEHHAVAYYPGWESLARFRLAQETHISDERRFERIILNGHLQVAFEKKKYLLRAEVEIFTSLKRRYRGMWPALRSHRPARVPWIVNAEEARDLAVLMEQTLVVLRRPKEKLLHRFDAENFFLRTWDGRDSICRAEDMEIPASRPGAEPELPAGALDGLEKPNIRLEVDVCIMPTPIGDVPRGEPPYFPMALLVVDTGSGQILGLEMFETVGGLDPIFARIPQTLTKILKKARVAPEAIAARHPDLVPLLTAYGEAYDIEFEEDECLDSLDEALAAIMGFAGR